MVPPSDSRNLRPGRRARGGVALEALEPRELLAYSALGFSLPSLALKGYSSPVAAYGGSLNVTIDVYNRGASTLVEPLNQAQGAPSTADAPASTVEVFASTRPGRSGVLIGTLNVPTIHQNDVSVVTGNLTLPTQPAGFPGSGGKIYLTFVDTLGLAPPNAGGKVATFVSRQAVTIEAALPDLRVVGFQVPSPLAPGDTLQPGIRVANIGTADTDTQGPVTVDLVASLDTNFGPGDTILATYTAVNISAASTASTTSSGLGDGNVVPGNNIITFNNAVITLPSSPTTYYLGVKVDPFGTLKQLGFHGSARFDAFVKVGPAVAGQAPVNYVGTATTGFPFPLGYVSTTTTTTVPPVSIEFTSPTVGTQQLAAIQGSRFPRSIVSRPATGPTISPTPTTFKIGRQ